MLDQVAEAQGGVRREEVGSNEVREDTGCQLDAPNSVLSTRSLVPTKQGEKNQGENVLDPS